MAIPGMRCVKFHIALSIPALILIAVIVSTDPGGAAQSGWPSYNRTLTSERYSSLDQINARNIAKLKIVCTYDTKQETGFQTGLVQVDGALFATTEQDIFSIDPDGITKF